MHFLLCPLKIYHPPRVIPNWAGLECGLHSMERGLAFGQVALFGSSRGLSHKLSVYTTLSTASGTAGEKKVSVPRRGGGMGRKIWEAH